MIAVSVTLSLAVLEVITRIFWDYLKAPIIHLSLKTHRLSDNEKLGYELIPNISARQDGTWYKINKDGLRDYHYPQRKLPGTYRIAAIGDSFTFGLGVEMEHTWPKLLENKLRRLHPNSEVINFGVMGYDIHQLAEMIRIKALQYDPCLIVLAYNLNDIGIFSRERKVLKQHGRYHQFMVTSIGYVNHILSYSKLYMLIKDRLYLTHVQLDTEFSPGSLDKKNRSMVPVMVKIKKHYDQEENLGRLSRAMNKIYQVRQSSVPVVIAIYPELKDFRNYPYHEEHDIIEDIATDVGFHVLDPLYAFQKHDAEKLRVRSTDTHPNNRANDLFTDALLNFLHEKDLLPATHKSQL
ncbi:MAG: hypothetical protein A2Y62_13715 [Candidatus Fischerbacteria bacterium RBG_13_37_8]|uniref:SGNH hydrolase-type esterase domain-containing protein n=1 Tax=Candidatus Fischerbacteria bacterium RBG_13_37_8 TaxID=1817863 RepID=A0A1F5V7R2_9BACT|nr:MAG: hypothetical protein A2Y62_13715 [Candidatus Fischerbacteria bacterium RBG_13_37_8]